MTSCPLCLRNNVFRRIDQGLSVQLSSISRVACVSFNCSKSTGKFSEMKRVKLLVRDCIPREFDRPWLDISNGGGGQLGGHQPWIDTSGSVPSQKVMSGVRFSNVQQ